jgi:O-antigen ligase
MQYIYAPAVRDIERSNLAKFFIAILIALALIPIAFVKSTGIIIACLLPLSVLIIPFYYKKPHIFLLFSLLIYPFTRYLPLDNKFIITGALYVFSFPCAIWVFFKYFKKISSTSVYLWAMMMYLTVIAFNIFRPNIALMGLVKEFGRLYYVIFIVLAVHNYIEKHPENLMKLCKFISYTMNIIALIAIGQYVTRIGGIYQEGIYRAVGTFGGFNDYAFILSVFICFSLYFILIADNHKARIYWTITIALNIIALFGTVSKTALFNTALIFMIMSMFLSWKRKFQLFIGGTIIGVILFEVLILSGAYSALVTRFGDTTSFMWRLEIWRTLYNLVLQGNIFVGQGAEASRSFLQMLVVPGESFAPHNIYLETLYNFGIIGLIPFVLMFIFAMFQGISIYIDRTVTNQQHKIIGASVIIISLVAIIQNFFSNAYYDRACNVLYWVILTLLVCWHDHYKKVIDNHEL